MLMNKQRKILQFIRPVDIQNIKCTQLKKVKPFHLSFTFHRSVLLITLRSLPHFGGKKAGKTKFSNPKICVHLLARATTLLVLQICRK